MAKQTKHPRSAEDRGTNQPAAKRRDPRPGKLVSWVLRIACGVVVGLASYALSRWFYPMLHPGKTGLWQSVFGAVLNQIWGQLLIAQPLLGWWPNEDNDRGYDVLTSRQRMLAVAGGIVAIVVMAAFIALVGESSGGF